MSGGRLATTAWRTLKGLLNRDNYAKGPKLQERADLLRLYLLTGLREPKGPAFADGDVEDMLDEMPSSTEQRARVRERVRTEALTLLERWQRLQPPPLPPESEAAPLADSARAALVAERAAAVVAAQRRAFGFSLSVGPSTAGPEGGRGVFISGEAPPGAVIAFYPGVTFDPFDLLLLRGGVRRFEGNEYLMARFDRTIVDASVPMLKHLPVEALDCPLSTAHLVNHPPSGSEPNVMPAPVDWDSSVPPSLLTMLPNVSYAGSAASQPALSGEGDGAPAALLGENSAQSKRGDTWAVSADMGGGGGKGGGGSSSGTSRRRSIVDLFQDALADIRPAAPPGGHTLKGLSFVATRPLRDEELFLNYRLNPSNGYPPWYTPVDVEEDERRWQR